MSCLVDGIDEPLRLDERTHTLLWRGAVKDDDQECRDL